MEHRRIRIDLAQLTSSQIRPSCCIPPLQGRKLSPIAAIKTPPLKRRATAMTPPQRKSSDISRDVNRARWLLSVPQNVVQDSPQPRLKFLECEFCTDTLKPPHAHLAGELRIQKKSF